jgi:hypothetical protein
MLGAEHQASRIWDQVVTELFMNGGFPASGVVALAGQPRPPANATGQLLNITERRRHTRFPVSPWICGALRTEAGDDFAVELIKDVSVGGVGLVLDRRLEPGTMATLFVLNVYQNITCRAMMRVVHAARRADGTFRLGGAFVDALDPANLDELLW